MRGYLRKRGDSWRAQIYIGIGVDGKKKYRGKSFRAKKDAEAWIAAGIHEMQGGAGWTDVSTMTVAQWLAYWLDNYATNSVAPKTLQEYRKIIDGYTAQRLGHIRLAKLKGPQIQHYYTELLTNGSKRGDRGLSPQTVLHHHTLIHKALRDAVRGGYIVANPADSTVPPKPEDKEVECFSPTELLRIRQCAARTSYHLPILLAMYTGMRRSEVCALRWQDIDLAGKTIHVKRAMEQTTAGIRTKETKTKRSRRPIPICQILLRELERAKGDSAPEAYVVPGLDGGPMRPSRLSSMFDHVLRRAEIGHGSMHILRHTFVSTLIAEGISLKVIQELVGHSTIVTTMDRYGHLAQSKFGNAADAFDRAMLGNAEQMIVDWKEADEPIEDEPD